MPCQLQWSEAEKSSFNSPFTPALAPPTHPPTTTQWSEAKKSSYVKHAVREYDIHKALAHPR